MDTQTTYFIAMCIACVISGIAGLVGQLHMLQQNSYYPTRYLKWMYESYFVQLALKVFLFAAVSVSSYINLLIGLIIMIIFATSQAIFTPISQKRAIKKLVFTSRVLRLFALCIIYMSGVAALAVYCNGFLKGIFFALTLLFGTISPALLLAGFYTLYPLEEKIRKYYITDAEKIVSSNTGLRVIGVTGSYGKTGTKFILERILSEKFNCLATPQSYNTTMGVVRTIREKLRPQTEIFICEMGAKNIGDIKEICDIVSPSLGIITAVGPQHLETFKSIDNVFSTKFELYDAVKAQNGNVYVNADSEALVSGIDDKDCITYGFSGEYSAQNVSYTPSGAEFTIKYKDIEIPVSTKLLGRHNVINITGAAAVALGLGISPEEIKFAVSHLAPTPHRLELKPFVNGSVMLDDAYNANPEGSLEAVNVLGRFDGMRKIIITPGLVELGKKEFEYNYNLGLAAARVCDIIIIVGKRSKEALSKGVEDQNFDTNNLFFADSFAHAVNICTRFTDNKTAVLVENDLPDNYLN